MSFVLIFLTFIDIHYHRLIIIYNNLLLMKWMGCWMNKIRSKKGGKKNAKYIYIYNFGRNVKNDYNDSRYKNSSKVFNLADIISLYVSPFDIIQLCSIISLIVAVLLTRSHHKSRRKSLFDKKNRHSPHNSRQ